MPARAQQAAEQNAHMTSLTRARDMREPFRRNLSDLENELDTESWQLADLSQQIVRYRTDIERAYSTSSADNLDNLLRALDVTTRSKQHLDCHAAELNRRVARLKVLLRDLDREIAEMERSLYALAARDWLRDGWCWERELVSDFFFFLIWFERKEGKGLKWDPVPM